MHNTRALRDVLRDGLFIDGDWVESKDQDPNGTIRLTQLADVGETVWRDRSDRWMNEEQAHRIRITKLLPGDVLVARMPDPLGRACLVPETIGQAATVVDVAILRPSPLSIDNRFLMYAINSRPVRNQIELLQAGATRQRVSRRNLGGVQVPLPPLDEQRAIADYLDQETAQIDALVAKQEEFIRLLRDRRGAVADLEFQGSDERRAATIRQVLVRHERSPKTGAGVVTAYRDGVVTLRSNRRGDGYTMSAAEAGYQGVLPGDIVFHALDGFAGAVGVSDSEGQSSPVYHVCRPRYDDDAEYLALFIRYLGTSGFLSTQAPSTRQRSVDFRNWGTFARVPLRLPSVEHQKAFVAEFQEQTTRIDALIAKAEEHITLAKERRSALITAAVTGQIDVRTARKAG
ncbi:restriction endonuclease subunit S [Curtobacterium flaccumfaciens pv. poinsettiae]|uniref:restriction endonuclease subunit S n=1 Tax=Curtobacterium poinsettiae TaxID=159612 RepID=UPI001BDFFBFD|nr:restriction endonuclease subunit S [Curtobacterium flaccumfaciens]MBT1619997.1 restriction endonuclease subunit S [Curtobacterium flaccumfaciens pv. poinsettiae]